LKKNRIIQNITALALLLLFVLSNTPKQWLHDAFASHKDCVTTPSAENNLKISQQGFYCDCDSLVVEKPFFAADKIFVGLPALAIYSELTLTPDKILASADHFFFQLRGPPSLA
jgi:hypothetical protein